jgi:hypothetical protein
LIAGLVPLVIATGAGMLAAATVGVFFIPVLYVIFQWLRERVGGGGTASAPAPVASAPQKQTTPAD